MSRPSFFIVGNSKSGTTALFYFLQAHPGIFMCEPKEPNYFAADLCHDPDPAGFFHPRTESEYLALFDDALPGQVCGEASACYLYSQVAARAIRDFDPDARLIAVLREPVDFLYSYYLQMLRNPVTEGEVERDFARALALEDERRSGRGLPHGCLVPELLYYRERVRYAAHLERVYASFDPSRVLVLLYEDFRRDNLAVYRQILSFLDVDPDFEPPLVRYNEGAILRSRRMQRAVRQLEFGEGWGRPVKAAVRTVVGPAARTRLRRAVSSRFVFEPKQALDPELESTLKREFEPEVRRVGELLGRDLLSVWGYADHSGEA